MSELAERFGPYGGRYVPETVIGALDELGEAFQRYRHDIEFATELDGLLSRFVGRPTPLYRAQRLGARYGVDQLYFKREDLCHTGAHKINNALGQVLLAQRMGKQRIIAETGAGPFRDGMLHLHGPARHGAPAPERHSDEDAGRRGAPGRCG
jgi:tryptophan synthase beta chain